MLNYQRFSHLLLSNGLKTPKNIIHLSQNPYICVLSVRVKCWGIYITQKLYYNETKTIFRKRSKIHNCFVTQ